MGLWLQRERRGTVPTPWTHILNEEKDQVSKRNNPNLGSRSTEISEALHWLKGNTWHLHTGRRKRLPPSHQLFHMFCYSTSKIHNRFPKLLKIRGKKRDRESHTRVAISTVVRYSFWIGIRDCISPEVFNQQPSGSFFPFGPESKYDRSWFFHCKSFCITRTTKAESLEFDASFTLWFVKQRFTVLSDDTGLCYVADTNSLTSTLLFLVTISLVFKLDERVPQSTEFSIYLQWLYFFHIMEVTKRLLRSDTEQRVLIYRCSFFNSRIH